MLCGKFNPNLSGILASFTEPTAVKHITVFTPLKSIHYYIVVNAAGILRYFLHYFDISNTLKGFRTPAVSEFFFVLSWECNKSEEFLECKKPNLPLLEGPGSKWKAVAGFIFPC